MPHIVRDIVEGRVAIDLGFCWLKILVALVGVRRGDLRRRDDPDRYPLTAACIDVARCLNGHHLIAGMDRANMAVAEPGPRADDCLLYTSDAADD